MGEQSTEKLITSETMFGLEFPPSDTLETNPYKYLGWLDQVDQITAEQTSKKNPYVNNAKELSKNLRIGVKQLVVLLPKKQEIDLMAPWRSFDSDSNSALQEFEEIVTTIGLDDVSLCRCLHTMWVWHERHKDQPEKQDDAATDSKGQRYRKFSVEYDNVAKAFIHKKKSFHCTKDANYAKLCDSFYPNCPKSGNSAGKLKWKEVAAFVRKESPELTVDSEWIRLGIKDLNRWLKRPKQSSLKEAAPDGLLRLQGSEIVRLK